VLVVIVILGVIAAVVFANQAGSRPTPQAPSATPTIGTSSRAAAGDMEAAADVSCKANYQAVTQAVSYYQALHGAPPVDIAEIQSLLKDPVSNGRFAISIDPHHPGTVEVAAGGHPAQSGDGNCSYAG
jgi:hypothetical protein